MDTWIFLSVFPLTGFLLSLFFAFGCIRKGKTAELKFWQWSTFLLGGIWAYMLQAILFHIAYR